MLNSLHSRGLLGLAFGLGLICATPSSGATLTAGFAEAYPGEIGASIPIFIEGAAGDSVSTLQFDIAYGQDTIHLPAVTPGPAAEEAGKMVSFTPFAPGVVRVLVAGFNQTAVGDGVIAEALFDVPADTPGGFYAVALGMVNLSDPYGIPLEVNTIGGGLQVIRDDEDAFEDDPEGEIKNTEGEEAETVVEEDEETEDVPDTFDDGTAESSGDAVTAGGPAGLSSDPDARSADASRDAGNTTVRNILDTLLGPQPAPSSGTAGRSEAGERFRNYPAVRAGAAPPTIPARTFNRRERNRPAHVSPEGETDGPALSLARGGSSSSGAWTNSDDEGEDLALAPSSAGHGEYPGASVVSDQGASGLAGQFRAPFSLSDALRGLFGAAMGLIAAALLLAVRSHLFGKVRSKPSL